MPKLKEFFYLILILSFCNSFGQKKSIVGLFTSENIIIDGNLNENSWNDAPIATDFFMIEPDNGAIAPFNKKTEVKVLYNNEAIFVSAILYDENPHLILKEITPRDLFGTADHFGVYINGYNDGQQDFRFFVSASGVQVDCISTENNDDYDWDAIWDSEVKITDIGWIVEMKIPYAALRFSKDQKQTWGINFYREVKHDRHKFTWNLIDMNIGNALPQAGILEGIENIKPPTRLFFIPYAAYYYDDSPNKKYHSFKAGLDIKYGINDSFTLDAILIPDFGQTKYDNVELNLSPFEQKFNENRPFFTEGTDLFNKGDLLYSRRIGSAPSRYHTSEDPDVLITNPSSVNLINAIKLSGRTSKGLGIGVLNAVTEKTNAIETNTVTQEKNNIVVEPITNYNVLVLDQRFNQNSSVSFVNTNVTRNGHFRDANVSALIFDINSKDNKFFVNGDFKYSLINDFADEDNYNGLNTSFQIGKKGGSWRYNTGGNYVSKKYDPNDLGINYITNYTGFYTNLSYRILSPSKYFNTFRINTNLYGEIQNTSGKIQQGQINFDITATTLKNHYVNFKLYINPLEVYDFYESRTEGKYVIIPRNIYSSLYISTNYNHPFALDINPYTRISEEKKRLMYGITIAPRYRINNRFLINYSLDFYQQKNDQGIAGYDNYLEKIVFSKRDRNTISNELGMKYAFNPKMSFNLSARYYWSFAESKQFLTLQDNGRLSHNSTFNQNVNSDFSTLNLDLTYSWWFAPGSQLSVMYRNNSSYYSNIINKKINHNFSNLIDTNLNNVFSVSLRYFIDYNQVKNKF